MDDDMSYMEFVLESAGWGTEEDYGYYGEEAYSSVCNEMYPSEFVEVPF